MIDLFNKKKVKQLETEIEQQNKVIHKLFDDLEKNSRFNCLLEANQKAYDWIQKILETFGTVEIRDRRQIYQIPIYKAEDYTWSMGAKREEIIIPSIKIVKERQA